jgi:Putative polyhydroxyalkanoic acid system protein (PHA_gran_rgn)
LRIEVPHNTTRDKARKIVEQKMKALESQYGHYANDIDHQWQGDTLHFGFKAKGFTGKGTLEITESGVIIDGKLPLIAKPFESRIRSTVEREAEEMFRA